MSLTQTDLQQIRQVVIEGVEAVTGPRFDAIEADIAQLKTDVAELRKDVSQLQKDVGQLQKDVGQLQKDMRDVKAISESLDGRAQALEDDVREIYVMLKQAPASTEEERRFQKLTLEKQILITYKNTLTLAKKAGITLPRS